MDCVFCKIIKGDIPSFKVWEDEQFFAFLDINPMAEGHTLLIPKEHVSYIFDYDDPSYSEIFQAAKIISKRLKILTKAKKIGMAIEGISNDHLHIHLVPVNSANDLDPNKAKSADMKELKEFAEKLLEYK